MSGFADIYVALRSRSKIDAIDFLNEFSPIRELTTTVLEFPQHGQKTNQTFAHLNELLEFLENQIDAEYNLYFRNLDDSNPNKYTMLFYTSDNALIFGFSRYINPSDPEDTTNEDAGLEELKSFLNTNLGYISFESTPKETFRDFEMFVMEGKDID